MNRYAVLIEKAEYCEARAINTIGTMKIFYKQAAAALRNMARELTFREVLEN